ncbi:DUF5610 domain-containing protein [Colwellia hornerae]|uniref:DUF5610 domain-containing protein n=1 Tax=Colwellia hornerae TaxID=89402 RepID=A0A5C6Q270_9GAMM|nr:DUF5610 domain-containing protein [Colwellia hornerae]TWX45840.1 hypothetical protein ESZ28_18470 [Colwellia hornerae]TWX53828.1 hypothetical protein ESZ26_18455 [Colwellia hornerae]TWX63005.1 hypothetical protein ESZ27_18300 [Colwellia hornerae]
MNKIDNQTTLPNYLGQNLKGEQVNNEAVKRDMPAESFDTLALNHRAAITMKIISQSISSQISANFQKFNDTPQATNVVMSDISTTAALNESEASTSLFDFEAVARNVMDFVGASILAAQANGASDDKLEEMFEQGRAGVNLGIEQAKGDLKDLAMLDDELNQGIEKSRDLINKGIDDLHEKMFPSANTSNDNLSVSTPSIGSTTINSELNTSNSKSSELTITTTDGDVVSISFSELQEYARKEDYQYQESNQGASTNYSSASNTYHEINFSYSVEGKLDDDEKAAIESLIKDVNSLQKDFFNGDVNQAFEKAIELGFDNKQITSFSMDLQQTKTSYVSQAYTRVAESDDKLAPSIGKDLRPLIDFLDQFNQLQEQADKLLSKNDDAFGQLLDAVFKAEFGENKIAKEKFDKVIETVKPVNNKI